MSRGFPTTRSRAIRSRTGDPGRGPVEDCGGPWAYQKLIATCKRAPLEEYLRLCLWLGELFDPSVFDRQNVNEKLQSGAEPRNSNAGSSRQGDCMLKILEEVLPIVVVPSSTLSFVFRPGVDPIVLFDSRGNKPPYERQVHRRVLGSHLAVVLPEGHIEHPVQPIFDLPVPPGRLQNILGVGLERLF
ncbi:hypothetical protein BSZ35_09210 [Salinibacter sp. 10B]|nr:hypothetical protein BSZ35_09210 [Salinibacter sp. 10B]